MAANYNLCMLCRTFPYHLLSMSCHIVLSLLLLLYLMPAICIVYCYVLGIFKISYVQEVCLHALDARQREKETERIDIYSEER